MRWIHMKALINIHMKWFTTPSENYQVDKKHLNLILVYFFLISRTHIIICNMSSLLIILTEIENFAAT